MLIVWIYWIKYIKINPLNVFNVAIRKLAIKYMAHITFP